MILDDLQELFDDLDYDGPTERQLRDMYSIYKKEVCNIYFNNERIMINKNRSHHPICRGMNQTFEHLITRKGLYSNRRDFDRERANRIHWIKPMIENYENPKIKYFEKRNHKNELQYFFHYWDRDFIVLLRQLTQKKMLITAYHIDDGYNRNNFKKDYEIYRKSLK